MTELESGGWWGGRSESLGIGVYLGKEDGSIGEQSRPTLLCSCL
jgi:hypothetical protein